MNFGATDYAIHFNCRNAFSFHPVLATEARNQRRVFADATPSGDGFSVNDLANNFHKFSLSQNPSMSERYAPTRSKIPSPNRASLLSPIPLIAASAVLFFGLEAAISRSTLS